MAICIWPAAVVVASLFFTWCNGAIVARRSGVAPWRQFFHQLRRAVAGTFLKRCETKRGAYTILERNRVS